MSLPSASYTSAIMNAVPAVIFIIDVLLRLERLKMRGNGKSGQSNRNDSNSMTVFKGPIVNLIWSPEENLFDTGTAAASSDQHWPWKTLFSYLLVVLHGLCSLSYKCTVPEFLSHTKQNFVCNYLI